MREIKFRGKRYGDGAWVYGSLYQGTKEGEKYGVILNDSGYHLAPPDDRNLAIAFAENEVNMVIPDTIGQFTGLHDKNGKEIYEGDIVCANHFFVRYDGYTPKPIRNAYNIEIDQKGLVTSVLYSRNYAIEFYPNKGWIMRNGSDQHRMHSIKGEAYIEVIGNIHDNPELLNK